MQQVWSQLENLLSEMRPLLVDAGIPEKQVQMPIGKLPEDIKIDQYVKAFDWLHELKISREWEVLVAAKALLPQAAWANYKALNMKGLREQVILESAQALVRKAWRNKRPSFFGRTYKPKSDD